VGILYLGFEMCAPIAANAASAATALAMLVNYITSAVTIGTLLLFTFKGRAVRGVITRALGVFRNR